MTTTKKTTKRRENCAEIDDDRGMKDEMRKTRPTLRHETLCALRCQSNYYVVTARLFSARPKTCLHSF